MDYILENITDLSELSVVISSYLINGIKEADPDFNWKMQIAKYKARTANDMVNIDISGLFSSVEAPNYDLSIDIDSGSLIMTNLFVASIFKTITIEHNAGIQRPSDTEESVDVINAIASERMFEYSKAEKVTIKVTDFSSGHGINGGWYMLASIGNSMIDTFDVGYINPVSDSDSFVSIDFVVEKILPDVSQDEHKPNIIFRNFKGEATEELKQKVLDKGYLSVEFYKGDTKVL